MTDLIVRSFIEPSKLPIFELIESLAPWEAVKRIDDVIVSLIGKLDKSDYSISNNQAIHHTAQIEPTAQLKGPMIIGPNCFVANGSLLRGGVILDTNCIVGHCGELKTSIMFSGSKIAHLNFVGDSILGNDVNVEGGAIIANYRNEYIDKEIHIVHKGNKVATGVDKFGAILGDGTRIGANASIAPGTVLQKKSIVRRGANLDQCD